MRAPQKDPETGLNDMERSVANELVRTFYHEYQSHVHRQRVNEVAVNQQRYHNIRGDFDTLWRKERKQAEDNVEEATKRSWPSDTWIRLTHMVIAQQMDPTDFIRAQFAPLTPMDDPPWPNMLTTDPARANYFDYQRNKKDHIRQRFRSQQNKATQRINWWQRFQKLSPLKSWKMALTERSSLTPLFRYCMACQIYNKYGDEEFKEIARCCRVDAAVQYVRHADTYDEVWGKKWIPRNFRDKAFRIYRQQFGQSS
jgi:hypothetical protein